MLIEDAYPKEIAKLKTAGRTASLLPKLIDLAAYRLSREHPDDVVATIIKATYGGFRSAFSSEKVERAKDNTVECLKTRVKEFKTDNEREVSKAAEYLNAAKKVFDKIADGIPLETDDPSLPHLLDDVLHSCRMYLKNQHSSFNDKVM